MENAESLFETLIDALAKWEGSTAAIAVIVGGLVVLVRPLISYLTERARIHAASSVIISIKNKDGTESKIELDKKDVSSEDLKKLISMVSKSDG